MTTPYLEVDNFTAEKQDITLNYVSGDVDKYKVIIVNFTIINSHNNRGGIDGDIILYDKYDNIINNFPFSQGDVKGEYTYSTGELKNADKVKKIELVLYNSKDDVKLYRNNTTNIQKVDSVEEIDDTPNQYYDVDDTQHRELTEREILEMDTEAYLNTEVGDYYWGHDEDGNLKRYKKHHPIFG